MGGQLCGAPVAAQCGHARTARDEQKIEVRSIDIIEHGIRFEAHALLAGGGFVSERGNGHFDVGASQDIDGGDGFNFLEAIDEQAEYGFFHDDFAGVIGSSEADRAADAL